jgi:hypothetical protein
MMFPRHVRTIGALCAFVLITASGYGFAPTPEHVEKLKSTGSCSGCDLFGENLSGLQAPNADLTNANLGEALFYGANLGGANLTGAVLDGANFKMANLKNAVGVNFSTATTDERTVCPNGNAGPCQ